ncbi:MAG TPA: PaaI family thioesterase [Prolixibacteraceae bacterium]|nr:PaaI family thioesterase [Prolixibacteraceae bacterium]
MTIPKLTVTTPIGMIEQYLKGTMIEHLGIRLTAFGEGWVEATMPIDHRTFRPGGMLHGGANLALAETIAGFGSMLTVDIQHYDIRGIQVSANHTGKADGSVVYARAEVLHLGKRTHVWNVDIKSEDGKLVSTARVTNMIVKHDGK